MQHVKHFRYLFQVKHITHNDGISRLIWVLLVNVYLTSQSLQFEHHLNDAVLMQENFIFARLCDCISLTWCRFYHA